MPLLQTLPEDCVSRILYYLGGESIVRVHEVKHRRCLEIPATFCDLILFIKLRVFDIRQERFGK